MLIPETCSSLKILHQIFKRAVSHPLDIVAFEHSGNRCFVLILHPQDITKDLPDLLVIMLLLRGSELIHLALLENLKLNPRLRPNLSQLHAMFLLFKINKDFLPSVVLLRPERGSEHRRRPVPFRRDDLLADPAGQAAELLVQVVSYTMSSRVLSLAWLLWIFSSLLEGERRRTPSSCLSSA